MALFGGKLKGVLTKVLQPHTILTGALGGKTTSGQGGSQTSNTGLFGGKLKNWVNESQESGGLASLIPPLSIGGFWDKHKKTVIIVGVIILALILKPWKWFRKGRKR